MVHSVVKGTRRNTVPGPLKLLANILGGMLVGTHTTAVPLQFYSVVVTHLNEYRIADN